MDNRSSYSWLFTLAAAAAAGEESREPRIGIVAIIDDDFGLFESGWNVKAMASSNSSRLREMTHRLKSAKLSQSCFLLSDFIVRAVFNVNLIIYKKILQ
jgi:hypothetical protein